jgi:type VI secretion system protein
MSKSTLLERLSHRSGLVNPIESRQRVIESIQRHLTHLFNTRRGHCLIRPDDYGMIDLADLGTDLSRAASTIEEEIKHIIDEFEPRLKVVEVKYLGASEFPILRFRITAWLVLSYEDEEVLFNTELEPSGFVRRIASIEKNA